MEKITTKSQKETQILAETLAQQLLKDGLKKQAVVLALSGDLGAGKTTFTQGFTKGLGIKEKVLSPTFVVMKKFKIKNSVFHFLYHIDCYRIKNETDLLHLDFQEILKNPENIIVIEWPEKIQKILSKKNVFWIAFLHTKNGQRELQFKR